MPQPRRLDKQAIRAGLAQETAQTDLKWRTVDATHTTTGHFSNGYGVASSAHQGRIQANLAELIDQYSPAFVGGLLRHQVLNQAGFAGTQRPGNYV